MIINVLNVKERFCPLRFSRDYSDDGVIPSNAKCEGDECMAWRWVDEDVEDEHEAMKGFCGLAILPLEIAKINK